MNYSGRLQAPGNMSINNEDYSYPLRGVHPRVTGRGVGR
ncbi:hypothetical protein SMJ63A_60188 [Stenotrophomonas geniculata]